MLDGCGSCTHEVAIQQLAEAAASEDLTGVKGLERIWAAVGFSSMLCELLPRPVLTRERQRQTGGDGNRLNGPLSCSPCSVATRCSPHASWENVVPGDEVLGCRQVIRLPHGALWSVKRRIQKAKVKGNRIKSNQLEV